MGNEPLFNLLSDARTVLRGERSARLSRTEYGIAARLYARGVYVPKHPPRDAVRINGLRRKLEPLRLDIVHVAGEGYRVVSSEG